MLLTLFQAISDWAKSRTLQQQRQFLPVFDCREELLQVIRENQVVVVVGETGSGKTTQVMHLSPASYLTTSQVVILCDKETIIYLLFTEDDRRRTIVKQYKLLSRLHVAKCPARMHMLDQPQVLLAMLSCSSTFNRITQQCSSSLHHDCFTGVLSKFHADLPTQCKYGQCQVCDDRGIY